MKIRKKRNPKNESDKMNPEHECKKTNLKNEDMK